MRQGITTETQADEVAQLLFYEDLKDVVLVGTSYGGMVACRTAELMRERISRLVFVDALTLFDGEKVADILPHSTAVADGVTLRPSPEDVANRLFADLDPKTRAWALERYTPHPIAFRFQPVKLDSFWSQQWKASVIWCRRAPNPGEAHQRRAAERLGAKWAGGSDETPPEGLDAAILFAPVGPLVPAALRVLERGGTVVCGGIHMSDTHVVPL